MAILSPNSDGKNDSKNDSKSNEKGGAEEALLQFPDGTLNTLA